MGKLVKWSMHRVEYIIDIWGKPNSNRNTSGFRTQSVWYEKGIGYI